MRILVYGASGTLYGGIESFLLNMNDHMSDGCIFDYVIVGDTCIHTHRIHQRGGRVYLVTSYKKNPLRFLLDSWKVAKEAKEDHKTAYFNLFSMCHITAVLMSRVLGYRIVLHAHNNNIPNKSPLYHLLHRFCRRLLSTMDCVRLTNSEDSSVFMFGNRFSGDRSAELIYNAIQVEAFRFSPEIREKKRMELELEDAFTVGFAGRLSAQKNPGFLMEIFAQIRHRRENTVFLVAGDGDLKAYTEQRARELGISGYVKFLGRREDLNQLYQAMDCFVLPSLFEGLGIVLIEAQAAGLPCFASAEVIPSMVQLSPELMHFISLDTPPAFWAEQILKLTPSSLPRETWNEVVAKSPFHIVSEATHLERILLQ